MALTEMESYITKSLFYVIAKYETRCDYGEKDYVIYADNEQQARKQVDVLIPPYWHIVSVREIEFNEWGYCLFDDYMGSK